MEYADLPIKFPIPFANAAGGSYIRPIPEASQIGIENGAASLTDGFPPLNFTPRGAGGVPPFGEDFNGLLNQITAWNQWAAAGGQVTWDGTFATSIGGYPKGAVLASATIVGLFWRSTAEDNATNPDDGATAANWTPVGRVKLTANTTFYVSATGSDTVGTGTNAAPWLTWQKAINVLAELYDYNGFTVTITSTTAATYAGGAIVTGKHVGQTTPLYLNFNSSTFTGGVLAQSGAIVLIEQGGVSSPGDVISCTTGASIQIGAGITLGTSGGGSYSICLATQGGVIQLAANFSYAGSGSCFAFAQAQSGGIIFGGVVATGGGVNTYSTGWAVGTLGGQILMSGMTFAGVSVTGPRYYVNLNGVVYTNGGGATYFPGSTGGSTATGGQYA